MLRTTIGLAAAGCAVGYWLGLIGFENAAMAVLTAVALLEIRVSTRRKWG